MGALAPQRLRNFSQGFPRALRVPELPVRNLPAAETVEALEALLPWNARSSLPAARRAA